MISSNRARNAWVAPAPEKVPALRTLLTHWADSVVVVSAMSDCVHSRAVSVVPHAPDVPHQLRDLAAGYGLGAAEKQRLKDAAIWYAADDMPALSVAVAKKPPAEKVRPDRLISDAGLMLFDEPFGSNTVNLREQNPEWNMARPDLTITTPIVAASWSHWSPRDLATVPGRTEPMTWWFDDGKRRTPVDPDFEGVWITVYGDSFDPYGELDPDEPIYRRHNGSVLTAGHLARMSEQQNVPRLMWFTEMVIPWGDTLSQAPEPNSKQEWTNTLYTAWQLISQKPGRNPIVQIEHAQPDNDSEGDGEGIQLAATGHDNGQTHKTGHASSDEVRIVRVHPNIRPPQEARDRDLRASTGRHRTECDYRWPVYPHRRKVCPNPHRHVDGECEHQEKIIGFHFNGPRGKPIRLDNRVYLWDR